jgi:putative restriction endonuclease
MGIDSKTAELLSFEDFLFAHNRDGSNKADSYIRALELLTPILTKKGGHFREYAEVCNIRDVERIDQLYLFILEQQRMGERGIFANELPASYWKNRYYSAAIGQYRKFLSLPEQKIISKSVAEFESSLETDPHHLIHKLENNEDLDKFLTNELRDYTEPVGTERLRLQKTRINQHIFREIILRNYRQKCCISGLNIPAVLRASHILPWAENPENRMNPSNGLCLAATYDSAFDRHLISFDDDFRLVLSPTLKEHSTNLAFQEQFLRYEGQKLIHPRKFPPNGAFLSEHRKRLFR